MWVLKIIFFCCLRKCFYIKKKKSNILPAISQLPTGAIELRVNPWGLPWISQELSQGQASWERGRGRTEPDLPRGACRTPGQPTAAWPRRKCRPLHRRRSLDRAPSLLLPVHRDTPDPTPARGSCSPCADPPFSKNQDGGTFYRVGLPPVPV